MDVSSRRYPHHRTPTCLEGGGISWSRPILERPKARGCVVIRRSCGLNVVGVPPSPMWRVVCPSPRGGKRACRARSVVVGRLGPYMGGRDAGAPAGRRLDRRGACVCRLVTRRHRPHNPRSNPGPTCPQTSVIAPPAQVCSRRRVCVWPLISSIYGDEAAHRRAAFRCVNVVQCARACIGMDGSASCRVFNRGRSWSIVVNRGLHSFIRDLAAQGSIVSIIVGQRTSLETRPGMSCVGTRSEAITSVVPNGRHSYEVS